MLEKELAVASELALEAGKILMQIYNTDYDVAYKSKSDPVTEADTRSNAYLVAALSQHFPNDGIVAEENVNHGDALQKSRCWYVDPVDGTKEFIAKNGEFAVMLGLAIDGVSQLGVVYQPEHDRLYRGVVNSGASLIHRGVEASLRVSDVSDPAKLRLVVSRSHRDEATDRFVRQLGITDEIKSGSVGLKVGLIAEQRADVYVHISDKSSAWDACGPEAILKAAGGRFTKLSGEPYRYGSEDMQNRGGIFACNAAAYDRVLPVAQAIGADVGLR
ncbi:MAG: 3'(2'),5'-bisphosphate nucleotidase CysQ [Polyangiales bacterium]